MSNTTDLQKASLDELELVRGTQDESAMDVRVNFPFSQSFPATTGLELAGGHSVVYFEIDPGQELGTHTDSPEEILVCLAGSNVQVRVGDAKGTVREGDLVVVPPMTDHGLANAGPETARFLGFFSDRTAVSEFGAPVEPFGMTTLRS